jgi:hypothetical protein
MKRSTLTWGLVFLLLGGGMVCWQTRPDLVQAWFGPVFPWPLIIIGGGALFLAAALASGVGGLAIPGAIILTTGGILYYQYTTGDWISWVYAWPLVPGGVGLGLALSGIIGKPQPVVRKIGLYLLVSAVLVFVVFYSIYIAKLSLNLAWAVVLILNGVYLVSRSFLDKNT